MRIVVILMLLASTVSFADQIATTEDGKKVILKEDGTWAYIEAKPQKNETADEYVKTGDVIKEKCKTDWPADFQMRAYCEKQQKEAVEKLKVGKPKDIGIRMLDDTVSRDLGMKMSGRKTESIYSRYAVVTEDRLRDASAKIDARKKTRNEASNISNFKVTSK